MSKAKLFNIIMASVIIVAFIVGVSIAAAYYCAR